MQTVKLNNGITMPILGYGTYETPPAVTEKHVAEALAAGFRSVDTAQCYGNEREVGLACRSSGVPRADLFITTKLWACRGYSDSVKSIRESQRRLGLGYIDLLLIHEPSGNIPEIYRAMEDAYRDGDVRAIGVSNFMPGVFRGLLASCSIVPAVNQTETHVFRQQTELRELEQQTGTRHESWSPLANGRKNIFKNPVLRRIAGEHGSTVPQTALRYLTQQGIIVIPKSLNEEHMRQNLNSLDLTLTDGEMAEIRALDEGRSLFGWW